MNHRHRLLRITFLLLASLSVASAGAKGWTVVKDGSSLRFSGVAQGESFEGGFGQFDADIRFDPAAPGRAKFDVRIALSSADTRNEERDDTLRGSEFFDVAQHPQARFVASEFVASDQGFEARGTLDLRGVTRPVTLKFSWTPTAGGARLDGSATLDRMAFGIGGGDWEDAEMIGHEVEVATTLILQAAD